MKNGDLKRFFGKTLDEANDFVRLNAEGKIPEELVKSLPDFSNANVGDILALEPGDDYKKIVIPYTGHVYKFVIDPNAITVEALESILANLTYAHVENYTDIYPIITTQSGSVLVERYDNDGSFAYRITDGNPDNFMYDSEDGWQIDEPLETLIDDEVMSEMEGILIGRENDKIVDFCYALKFEKEAIWKTLGHTLTINGFSPANGETLYVIYADGKLKTITVDDLTIFPIVEKNVTELIYPSAYYQYSTNGIYSKRDAYVDESLNTVVSLYTDLLTSLGIMH